MNSLLSIHRVLLFDHLEGDKSLCVLPVNFIVHYIKNILFIVMYILFLFHNPLKSKVLCIINKTILLINSTIKTLLKICYNLSTTRNLLSFGKFLLLLNLFTYKTTPLMIASTQITIAIIMTIIKGERTGL